MWWVYDCSEVFYVEYVEVVNGKCVFSYVLGCERVVARAVGERFDFGVDRF